ncbi:hypothetical protein HZA44_00895 [Candidatus Peregrinibacteria bacterium]|nr:hypothetical protein [Candidatus Peregrinibacteria bacterium]
MARLLKGDYETPVGHPTSEAVRAMNRQKSVEDRVRHTRSRVGKSVKKPGVNAELDSIRVEILEKIAEIFSKWGVQQRQLESLIGKQVDRNGLSWSDIRELIDHILLRWATIYSGVPDGSQILKELMEGDVDPADIDQAYTEVAQFFGFRDYDELTHYLELGEKSEKKGL